ncbi:MAG: DUF1674 domain-containing protein [Salinarimonadaceae bacterium]|nr:MAG: DUF1674 domain-containing protein [Salinarimonadaceae bacterium]
MADTNAQQATDGRSTEAPQTAPEVPGAAPGKALTEAAKRALAEAQERRAEIDARAAEIARNPERLGRGGLEPVRYNDWEIKGTAADF